MGLIHWWPLNGDTKDYGINNVTMETISSSVVTNTSGKIGKCYYNNSNSSGGLLSTSTIHIGVVQSMFCWMKFTSLESSANLGGAMVGTHRYSTNTGMGITIKYLSSTTGRISVNTGTGSSRTYNTYYGNTTLNANTWYHVGFTYDGSTIRLYVNGIPDGTASLSGMSVPDDYVFIGAWSLGGGTGNRALHGDYKLNGYINDVRIYDHALSQKEVKEISKGLVLHYDFEDEYVEGTINLAGTPSNMSNWGTYTNLTTTTIDTSTTPLPVGAVVKKSTFNVTSSGGNSYSNASSVSVSASSTYTISVYIKTNCPFTANYLYWRKYNSSGSQISEGGTANTTNRVNLGDGWYRYWAVVTTDANTTKVTFQSYFYPGAGSGYYVYYGAPQLEKKDHMTPWINGTRAVGKVYDSSGYGYDAVCSGNTSCRNTSVYGENYIKLPDYNSRVWCQSQLPTLETYTISVWARFTQITSGKEYDVFALYYASPSSMTSIGTGRTALQKHTNKNCVSFWVGDVGDIDSPTLTAGKWYNFICVKEKNGALKLYVDGVQMNGTLTSTATGNPAYPSLGAIFNNDTYSGEYDVADFKVYATAFSETDAKAEYNRKAAVDKIGNLFTGEIVENAAKTSPKIDKSNFVSGSTFSEGLMTKMLDDGSVFERIYYFDYDIAGGVWNATTAKRCNTAGKFSVLGSLNSYVPEDGWYEFYYREGTQWVRWKQSYNPLSRVTSGSSGTSSEYTYIGGSAAPYSSFTGMTRYSSDDSSTCYLRGAPSWWCCIAPYGTSYDVFPDMWGNSTNNHHQELWIRVDNLKSAPEFNDTKFKLNKTGVMAGGIHEI